MPKGTTAHLLTPQEILAGPPPALGGGGIGVVQQQLPMGPMVGPMP